MMKPLLTALLFLCLLSLAGCIGPDEAMKSFLNHPKADLLAAWGPPNNVMPDGNGGEVWTYFQDRQWTTPGQANTTAYSNGNTYGTAYANPNGATYQGNTSTYGSATTTYTPPQTHNYTARRTFCINSDGIIYRYSWQGL